MKHFRTLLERDCTFTISKTLKQIAKELRVIRKVLIKKIKMSLK